MGDESNTQVYYPSNFDDAEGWEKLYQAYYEDRSLYWDTLGYGHLSISGYQGWLSELPNKSNIRIWIPGCGLDKTPHWLAAVGFNVWASDVSPTAIQLQKEKQQTTLKFPFSSIEYGDRDGYDMDEKIAYTQSRPGELHFFVHDHRQPLEMEPFDYIINTRAFQGFLFETMPAVAQVHYDALKPKGTAFFGFINMIGSNYQEFIKIEDIFFNVGFVFPEWELQRKKELRRWRRMEKPNLIDRLQGIRYRTSNRIVKIVLKIVCGKIVDIRWAFYRFQDRRYMARHKDTIERLWQSEEAKFIRFLHITG